MKMKNQQIRFGKNMNKITKNAPRMKTKFSTLDNTFVWCPGTAFPAVI